MTDQKLNLNINLGEIQYLKVLDIIDYKWVYDAVADRKTIDM